MPPRYGGKASAVVAALALLAAGGTGVATAAALAPTAARLGAGTAAVAACASSGSVSWLDEAGSVTQVSISGLPAACNGATLSATLTAGTTDVGHGGPVVVSAGSATISVLTAAPSAGTVTDVYIALVGP